MMGARWVDRQRLFAIARDVAGALGLFTIAIELVEFFPALDALKEVLRQKWVFWLVLGCSFVAALVFNRPRRSFRFNLNGRDAELELYIGNIENLKISWVVPINSEFDVYLGGSVSSAASVKALTVRKHFDGDHTRLKSLIQTELRRTSYAAEKVDGKYKMGTVVPVEISDRSRRFYFVVNSHKQNDRRVRTDAESFYAALNGLWTGLSIHGAKEHIAIPLLGTGNGRLSTTRQDVYKEIVRSFLTACAARTFCSRLTIVIHEADIRTYKIDIEELLEFTRLQTRYADFKIEDTTQRGIALAQ
jgi:hypothetical protein